MKIKLSLDIDYITVLKTNATDLCIIHTKNLPNPVYPYTNFLTLKFDCAYGTGKEYCEKHFPGIEINEV